MNPRYLAQKSIVIKRQPVGDFVEDSQLGSPKQVGLPKRQYCATQLFLVRLEFIGRELHTLAQVEQRRNLHLAVDRALAAHLRRMRGQHRTDQGRRKKPPEVGNADAGFAWSLPIGRGRSPFVW